MKGKGLIKIFINSLVLASLPILSVYTTPSAIGVGALFVLFALLFNLQSLRKSLFFDSTWWLVLMVVVIGLISQLQPWGDVDLYLHNLFPFSIFFICVTILVKNINIRFFVNVAIVLSIIASIICLFQYSQLISSGSFDNFYIPNLELIRDVETISTRRPSSLFTEPAHLSIYLLPIFYFSLTKAKYLLSTLFGLTILACGSSTGFIVIIFLLAYRYLLHRRYFLSALPLLVISVFAILYYFPDLIVNNVNKLESDDFGSNIRIFGYLYYISGFSLSEHLFGVGLNHFDLYMMYTKGIADIRNYSNAFIFTYISYGIFGVVLFIKYLKSLFSVTGGDKGYIIILICILASDQVLFNANLIYPVTFVLLSSQLHCLNYQKSKV